MVSLKRSILQIWVTWASKIALKNLQLYSVKIKGSHAPCDITRSRFILDFMLILVTNTRGSHMSPVEVFVTTIKFFDRQKVIVPF